jgi:hypothetical protein
LVIRYSEGTIRIYNTVLLYVDMVNEDQGNYDIYSCYDVTFGLSAFQA